MIQTTQWIQLLHSILCLCKHLKTVANHTVSFCKWHTPEILFRFFNINCCFHGSWWTKSRLSLDLTFESDGQSMVRNHKKSLWITLCLITLWLFITRPSWTLICALTKRGKLTKPFHRSIYTYKIYEYSPFDVWSLDEFANQWRNLWGGDCLVRDLPRGL